MYVLMIVPSNFPNGDAGAVRDLSFAKIYQALGYKIILIGMGRGETKGVYEGVIYYSLYRKHENAIDHIVHFLEYENVCQKLVNNIIEMNGFPDVIHINDISHGMIKRLISLSIKNSIPIIHDSTEWYSPSQFRLGKFDKAYILKNRLNRKVIRKPIKVIAISEYLRSYYVTRGLQAIRVPVIMDVRSTTPAEEVKVEVTPKSKIQFIYAGSPAVKDHLKEILEAIYVMPEEMQHRIEVHILGVDEKHLCRLVKKNELPVCIRAYGRVPREEVLSRMKQMDFSLLLRPAEERYAKAGFPTKSVEAMSCGVAMMCNITSDLGMYLKDGENAVLIDGCSSKAVLEAFMRILEMNRDDIDNIKREARKLAERFFDYGEYIDSIRTLVESK